MAAGINTVSFDEIIQADRQRRKNEALANEIFGRGRKSKPPSIENRKFNTRSTFANRAGVVKPSQRSSSLTPNLNLNAEAAWVRDLPHVRGALSRPSRRDNQLARTVKNERFYEAATDRLVRNGSSNPEVITEQGGEINIRGLAGPCVVVGSNFAPGTTTADIESAMIPSSGEMQSCKIVSYSPTLVAEMVFVERASAENVIATFNNKKADGRVLHVYMKQEQSTSPASSPVHQAPVVSRAPRVDSTRPGLPTPELPHVESLRSESARPEPLTPDPARSRPYDFQREQSDLSRRRAEPEVQDGSFGFESRDERMDVDVDNRRDHWQNDHRESERPRNVVRHRDARRLYSDDLYPRHRGRVFR